jgi:hypothetical protein
MTKISVEDLKKQLENLDEDEILSMAKNLEKLSEGPTETHKRPETDDELHQWILDAVGINIPRVAATEATNSPFEWMADLFFGRVTSALVLGSRGSGKSFCAALLNFALCYWYPDIECMSVGAIEIQAKRVYDHVKSFQNKAKENLGENKVEDSLMSVTRYNNGAKYEIVTSSRSAVNGPHCSPPDESVLTTNGYKRIDEIDPRTDQLASYSGTNNKLTWGRISGGGRYGKNIDFEFEVTSRPYQGELITMDTGEAKARITPNHKVRIKLAKSLYDKDIVYLMRKSHWWKIGITRGDRITRRVAEEGADDIWILEVFDNLVDAVEMELILQARYGITGCCFNPANHNSRINDPAKIHNSLSNEATAKAHKLLIDYNMFADMPLFSRTQGTADRKFIYNARFDTAAGNILPIKNHILVPEVTKKFKNKKSGIHHPIFVAPKITTEYYEGDVYSLDILPHHYYISGGIVVHNSQIVHRDEIELMDIEVYKESLNIEKSKKLADGTFIPTRTLLTSTRKTSSGLMQDLINQCKKAEEDGVEPPFKIYNTNIFDVTEKQNNCRVAYPELPEDKKCACNGIVSGEWSEGVARTFEDVCGGVLAKADGFTPIEDAQNIFLKSPQALWEAQQENKRPYVEDVSIPEFSMERHGIKNYQPNPLFGRIYQGIDFGGVHPFGISYIQVLDVEVEAENYNGVKIRIPEGTKILFDELYKSDIGNEDASEMIKQKEEEYRNIFPEFEVFARFGDRAAFAARKDFAKWGLPCSWPAVTRDRAEHLQRLRTLIQHDEFMVVTDNCPVFCEQISVWNINGKKKFDDMVDSVLYNYSNIYALEEKGLKSNKPLPSANKAAYNYRQGNPFYDKIGINVKQNQIGGMTTKGWIDSTKRGK